MFKNIEFGNRVWSMRYGWGYGRMYIQRCF